MTIEQWLECVGYQNLKWPSQPLDEPIARAWFTGTARYAQMDVMAAIDRLSWRMAFRPSLADIVDETTLLLKEQPPLKALPEARAAGVPAEIVSMVDAIIKRQKKGQDAAPVLKVAGHDYRPERPRLVERQEPPDTLQRWLGRHYVRGIQLACARCGKQLNVGDWFEVTSKDDLVHLNCQAEAAK